MQIVDQSRCLSPCRTDHRGIQIILCASPEPSKGSQKHFCWILGPAGPQDWRSDDICESSQYFSMVFLGSLWLERKPLKHQMYGLRKGLCRGVMLLLDIGKAWGMCAPKTQFICSQPNVLSLLHIFPGSLLLSPAYWEPSVSVVLIAMGLQS